MTRTPSASLSALLIASLALGPLALGPRAAAQDTPPESYEAAPVEAVPPATPPLGTSVQAVRPDVSEGWPSSTSRPGPPEPRVVHAMDEGRIILGGVLFGVGWLGAIAWGANVLASLSLGSTRCSDPYGGLQLVPLAGPLIGVGVGSGCVSLSVGEVFLPVLTTLFQLAGAAWLVAGLAGNDTVVYDEPVLSQVGLSIDASGASLTVGGRF
jgi:hypothetical protein